MYERLSKDWDALDAEMWQDVSCDEDNVKSDLKHASELKLKWGRLLVMAQRETADAEAVATQEWAEACIRGRTRLESESTARIVNARIEELAHTDARYNAAALRVRRCQELVSHLEKMEAAMGDRQFLLQALNNRQRTELEQSRY